MRLLLPSLCNDSNLTLEFTKQQLLSPSQQLIMQIVYPFFESPFATTEVTRSVPPFPFIFCIKNATVCFIVFIYLSISFCVGCNLSLPRGSFYFNSQFLRITGMLRLLIYFIKIVKFLYNMMHPLFLKPFSRDTYHIHL